jgi:hypothetical protein
MPNNMIPENWKYFTPVFALLMKVCPVGMFICMCITTNFMSMLMIVLTLGFLSIDYTNGYTAPMSETKRCISAFSGICLLALIVTYMHGLPCTGRTTDLLYSPPLLAFANVFNPLPAGMNAAWGVQHPTNAYRASAQGFNAKVTMGSDILHRRANDRCIGGRGTTVKEPAWWANDMRNLLRAVQANGAYPTEYDVMLSEYTATVKCQMWVGFSVLIAYGIWIHGMKIPVHPTEQVALYVYSLMVSISLQTSMFLVWSFLVTITSTPTRNHRVLEEFWGVDWFVSFLMYMYVLPILVAHCWPKLVKKIVVQDAVIEQQGKDEETALVRKQVTLTIKKANALKTQRDWDNTELQAEKQAVAVKMQAENEQYQRDIQAALVAASWAGHAQGTADGELKATTKADRKDRVVDMHKKADHRKIESQRKEIHDLRMELKRKADDIDTGATGRKRRRR